MNNPNYSLHAGALNAASHVHKSLAASSPPRGSLCGHARHHARGLRSGRLHLLLLLAFAVSPLLG